MELERKMGEKTFGICGVRVGEGCYLDTVEESAFSKIRSRISDGKYRGERISGVLYSSAGNIHTGFDSSIELTWDEYVQLELPKEIKSIITASYKKLK